MKKKVVNKSFTAILGEIFGAPHGLNLSNECHNEQGGVCGENFRAMGNFL